LVSFTLFYSLNLLVVAAAAAPTTATATTSLNLVIFGRNLSKNCPVYLVAASAVPGKIGKH